MQSCLFASSQSSQIKNGIAWGDRTVEYVNESSGSGSLYEEWWEPKLSPPGDQTVEYPLYTCQRVDWYIDYFTDKNKHVCNRSNGRIPPIHLSPGRLIYIDYLQDFFLLEHYSAPSNCFFNNDLRFFFIQINRHRWKILLQKIGAYKLMANPFGVRLLQNSLVPGRPSWYRTINLSVKIRWCIPLQYESWHKTENKPSLDKCKNQWSYTDSRTAS